MIDQLTKYIHWFFLVYAGYIGYEYQIELDQKLTEATGQLDTTKVQLARADKELKDVKKFEENLEQSKKKVREIVEKIEKVQKQLPSEIKDTQVNGKLESFANDLKMLNPVPVPKEEVNNKFYFSKDYNFDVQGTFLQFLIFYEKLEVLSKTDRILNVKYLRMRIADESDARSRFQILNLSTTVEAYRYNNNFDARDL